MMVRKKMILTALAAALCSCAGTTASTVVSDGTVATQDALCLLQQYSTEVGQGVIPAQAILDAGSKCNVAQNIASTFLSAHIAAEEREKGLTTDAGGP